MKRSTAYGDGIFETLRIANGYAYFVTYHYQRMLEGALILGFTHNVVSSQQQFTTTIATYIQTHQLTNARVRLQLSRVGAMGYACASSVSELVITHATLPTSGYMLPALPISYGVYTSNYKPCVPLSNVKTTSALLYVLAGNYALQNNCEEVLLLNQHQRVAEGYKSNVFIVKNNIVITPPLIEGALNGVMRKVILELCATHSITTLETPIKTSDVANATEVWFTNVIQGINCATPTITIAKQLITLINSMATNSK